jgi:hypothetical protein
MHELSLVVGFIAMLSLGIVIGILGITFFFLKTFLEAYMGD